MTDETVEDIGSESESTDPSGISVAESGEPKRGKLIRGSQTVDRDVDFSKTPAEALEAEVEVARAEARENYDKYLRALAELENFKKRVTKERSELVKYQGERIFADILDVVDDLERALQFSNADPAQLKSGVELIHKRFVDTLSKWEVRGESGVGKEFNPEYHNAISKMQSPDVKPGSIIGELKKVYFYKDKLLRHGEVVVAEAPSEGKKEEGEK